MFFFGGDAAFTLLKKNMKTLFALFSLIPITLLSQTSVVWVNYPGGVAVATDAANHAYTANWDYNPAGDITLTKRDADGTILWETAFDNTDNTRHEVATWIETDVEQNVIVSGTIRSGYSNPVDANALLMKFDPQGNLLWRLVLSTEFDGSSTKKCLVDANNNIYVLGFGNNGTAMSTQVKKFSPSGELLWTYADEAGIGKPLNFKFTPDQAILISARAIYGSINGFAKIDLNGDVLWNYAGVNSLTTGDAAGDQNGNAYLINGAYAAGNNGSVLTKLAPDGTQLWQHSNTMAGLRVEVGHDNHIVVGGYPSSGSFGAAFMKYDEHANVLWSNPDADGSAFNLLAHAQMKLDSSNAIYLVASTMTQMAVCKVNSLGASEWTITAAGSYAYTMDFGTDNSVFVTGGTTARIVQDDQVTGVGNVAAVMSSLKVFPNPFVSELHIEFQLDEAAFIEISLLDVLGRNVATLEETQLSAGFHTYTWQAGHTLQAAGRSYFLLIRKNGAAQVHKVLSGS